ncbi:hypothetical protein C1Y40_05689 [Mycobacterium talmoniae]|uniref:Uncharacterized protein n=1 Tax=Mycobacterium talmoniae TaxID=1858794 RepID=A0A2S8BBX8_9MYCO|nr:hypothetical protein C1Y40_05689 [Mycobacterium talmoniae]
MTLICAAAGKDPKAAIRIAGAGLASHGGVSW